MPATKTRAKREEPVDALPAPVAPAEAAGHEKGDWLDALPELEWLAAKRAEHSALAGEWARAVEGVFTLRNRQADAAREYRRAVREAVAVGDEPPEKPAAVDATLHAAEVEIALDDAADARDDLNLCAVEVLALLREHRVEVDLSTLSSSLLRALVAGGANQAAIAAEQARSDYAFLSEPRIETLIEPNGPTPDLESTDIHHMGAAA